MCKYIKEKATIYSNSIDIIEQLKDNATLDLHLLGGKLNPVNRYFYGSETLATLDNIRFDIAFLGAASITEDGFYTFENEDAAIKHLIAKILHLPVYLQILVNFCYSLLINLVN